MYSMRCRRGKFIYNILTLNAKRINKYFSWSTFYRMFLLNISEEITVWIHVYVLQRITVWIHVCMLQRVTVWIHICVLQRKLGVGTFHALSSHETWFLFCWRNTYEEKHLPSIPGSSNLEVHQWVSS